jgi:hypothetical protein
VQPWTDEVFHQCVKLGHSRRQPLANFYQRPISGVKTLRAQLTISGVDNAMACFTDMVESIQCSAAR